MKICVINSSGEGVDSPFEKYDVFPDPNWYILKEHHEFFIRFVTKEHAHQDIDQICEEGRKKEWDFYMNYMWGSEKDKVAGVEATKYLESKNVPILTNSSRFLKRTKLDLYQTAITSSFFVPGNTPGKFPKFVKYGDGYGGQLSLNTNSAVCINEEEMKKQISLMREKNNHLKILVQDYIIGNACSVIVIEMGRGVVALDPIQQIFPGPTPNNEAFLNWDEKFENLENGDVRFEFLEDDATISILKSTAIKAFKASDSTRSGWARVDLRIEISSGLVYVIDICSVPMIFYPKGNLLGDDLVISQRFPGGHPAFIDTLLATRQIQLGELGRRNARVAAIYDKNAIHYQTLIQRGDVKFFTFRQALVSMFEFSGTVLDMACGTGYFGELLHQNGIKAEITGIELSTGMLNFPAIKNHYRCPVMVGPMQELIMVANEYDHIVCFGGLHFLDRIHFNAVLARIFMLARKSITFEIDDLNDSYIARTKGKYGELCYNGNNVNAAEAFSTPFGWKKIYESRHEVFRAPSSGIEIWGIYFRYERASFLSGGDLWPI
ncbi:putative methyltransferase cpaM [Erysiphe necator]|nr:putative methyltransferase cpaM [Erysiphe necator]